MKFWERLLPWNTISTSMDLNDLFNSIHVILMDRLDATNFYIALIDEDSRRLQFPYYQDEIDQDVYEVWQHVDVGEASIKSPTLGVIRKGKPILETSRTFEEKWILGFLWREWEGTFGSTVK